MNMKFSLLELNTLYYALGKRQMEAQQELKEFGGDFFKRELENVTTLLDRVSAELDVRVKKLDNQIKQSI